MPRLRLGTRQYIDDSDMDEWIPGDIRSLRSDFEEPSRPGQAEDKVDRLRGQIEREVTGLVNGETIHSYKSTQSI